MVTRLQEGSSYLSGSLHDGCGASLVAQQVNVLQEGEGMGDWLTWLTD